jgi:integrase
MQSSGKKGGSEMPDSLPARRVKAPGLIWIPRKHGFTPYWRASDKGYKPRTVNLSRLADDPEELAKRCDAWQAEMLEWRSARYVDALHFDGTVGSLISIYLRHPQSSFQDTRPTSRSPYLHYAGKLQIEIGDRMVKSMSGLDLKEWHGEWSSNGRHVSAATMRRAVLDAAISFGVEARLPGCADTLLSLRAAKRKLPRPKHREITVTAEDVECLRKAAHADGRPSMALTYALVFETTLRLWDVIGQWMPEDAPDDRTVIRRPRKYTRPSRNWFGLCWEDIGPDLVLRYRPSKTSEKTGLTVTFPIAEAPMVMEELAHWPENRRTGPLIVRESTGLPYKSNHFGEMWRKDRESVGLSPKVWARDLRASGITEARAAGVLTDDIAKVAGHSSTKTTSAVYDRATLAAAERFARARSEARRT